MRPSSFPNLSSGRRRPGPTRERRRHRPGRLLIECCVAMMLLATSSAAILTLSANTILLVDDARQRDLVQRVVSTQFATLNSAPCLVGNGAARVSLSPRAMLDVATALNGSLRHVEAIARWQSSGSVPRRWREHRFMSAGWCP